MTDLERIQEEAIAALGAALDGALGYAPIGPTRVQPNHYAGHVLVRLQEHPERAAALVRALESRRSTSTAPDPIVADRPAARVPCPDEATFREHATQHRQRPDGSWWCEACEASRTAELLEATGR